MRTGNLVAAAGHERRIVFWLFAIALVLRLGYVVFYPQFPFGTADDRTYDETGWSLASGTGFTLAVDPVTRASGPGGGRVPAIGVGPTYPAFLAVVYSVFGHDLRAVRIAQAMLSAALVLLAWQVARAAGYSSRIAMVSAGLVAVYPAFIIYSGVVLSEMLFAFLLVIVVWVAMRAIDGRSAWRWVLAGGLMGITVLLRSESAIIVPIVAGIAVVRNRHHPLLAAGVVLFVVVSGLVVGLWTARNYSVFKEIVPVSANGGRTLWISARNWDEWISDDLEFKALVRGLDEVQMDRVLGRAALRNIADAPTYYLSLCFRRIPRFWAGSHTTYLAGFTESFDTYLARGAYGPYLVKAACLLANVGLTLCALVGVLRTFRSTTARSIDVALLLAPVVALATVHFFLFATSRYQVPIMPFVMIFAAVELSRYTKTWVAERG